MAVVESPVGLIPDGVVTLPVTFFGTESDPCIGHPPGGVGFDPTDRGDGSECTGTGVLQASTSAVTVPCPVGVNGTATKASGVVSLQPGSGFTVTPAPSPAWLLQGNAGTGVADFLGTTDPSPLELWANGVRALRMEPTGRPANLIGGFAGTESP